MNETSPLLFQNKKCWQKDVAKTMEPNTMDRSTGNAEAIELQSTNENRRPNDSATSSILVHNNYNHNNNNNAAANKLDIWSMAILVFYSVSGGPFGIETTVRAGGYRYALLGFLVVPLVWSLQESLMTAELGTAFPEASGGVVWVETAFGPFWGWMAGYLSWVAGATDNAIYPVLFLEYFLQVIGNNNNNDDDDNDNEEEPITLGPVLRFLLIAITTISLAYINWRGLDVVGKLSVLICVLAMSPFVVMVVVGSLKLDPSRWFQLPDANGIHGMDEEIAGGFFPNFAFGGILWRPFLNNLFWNLNSFDSAGCLVGELKPGVSFSRSMLLGMLLVVSCYFLPLLIAIGSSDAEQSDWQDGYLATLNSNIVGPWLGAYTVFAAGISNIGLFQAELSSDAFQLMGMADRGYLPKKFGERSSHGTPTYGLLLGTVVIVAMAVSDLDSLIEMLNFNYGFALLLEYAAFFKLRIDRPDLERPYKIPLGTVGCVFFFLPTVLATILVMSLATYWTYGFSLATWSTGIALYKLRIGNLNTYDSYEAVEHDESNSDATESFPDEEPLEDSIDDTNEVL